MVKRKKKENNTQRGWGGKREGAGRPKKEYIENVKELLAEHIDQEDVMTKLR